MKIDVIIPTYRPGRKFLELMKRLTSQSVKADRIIIMTTAEPGILPRQKALRICSCA